ncbi:hypothetical protein [Acinetobacter shaoyimingii]|uniref:Uncharacterized protein n=1 Tax=Acinetobacter shaoyimingii TaxID=2715164 RepID=A0A6G8RYM0_9GAMM|nr:hypothetical protein [Acinetobacter shaoyimingii]QIO06997.1 hypothetical protein G8E00_14175 [Acinetobacter shaoyimingii]
MKFKKSALTFLGLTTLFIHQSSYAISNDELKAIIECKSNTDHYQELTEDYEKTLSQLGWKRNDDPEHPLLYIYHHTKALDVFGQPTQEIALAGQAIAAVYRNKDYKPFAQKFAISQQPDFVNIQIFRGEKLVRTEPATPDRFTFYNKLVLSELTGKSPMSILGCSYEADKAEAEALFNDE